MNAETMNAVVDLYTNSSMTIAQVAEQLGLTVKEVRAILLVNSVPIHRGPRDGGALTNPDIRAKAIATRQHKAVRRQFAVLLEKYGEASVKEVIKEMLGNVD